MFGKVFANAMAGAADADRDERLTASELFAWLVNHISPHGQIPVASGPFDGETVLAEGMTGGVAVAAEPVYPDHEIWSAKFVFEEGGAHTVDCRDATVRSCEPSCYVRDFTAGPCNLTAVADGERVEGKVIALVPGKYTCGLRTGELVCTPPRLGDPPRRPE